MSTLTWRLTSTKVSHSSRRSLNGLVNTIVRLSLSLHKTTRSYSTNSLTRKATRWTSQRSLKRFTRTKSSFVFPSSQLRKNMGGATSMAHRFFYGQHPIIAHSTMRFLMNIAHSIMHFFINIAYFNVQFYIFAIKLNEIGYERTA